MEWTKHASAQNIYAVDFADSLTTGETLAGVPVMRVVRRGMDLTAAFVVGAPVVNGTEIRVVLGVAEPGTQAPGVYTVYAECGTSGGHRLVEALALAVSAEGRL